MTGIVEKRLRDIREEEGEEDDDDLGASLWVSGQSQNRDCDTTRFADGYDSNIWGVTVGADFPLNNSWIVGVDSLLNYV